MLELMNHSLPKRKRKIVTVNFQATGDNKYIINFKDKEGNLLKTFTGPTESGRIISNIPVTITSGNWIYLHTTVIETGPPVTSSNPCGIYLYDSYHKKNPEFVSGLYRAKGKAHEKWYSGPGLWSHVPPPNSNSKYNWIFKIYCPEEY